MQWESEGIVIAVRPFGEHDVLAEIFTRDYGRIAGFVKGGRGRKKRALLQIGNHLDVVRRARLNEQLGQFSLETITLFAAHMIDDAIKLAVLNTICAFVRWLPEREQQTHLYHSAHNILKALTQNTDPNQHHAIALLAKWELQFLADLGYGLDLSRCVATGTTQSLSYVSPRSGCAVSAQAGHPYRNKLFPLPQFLIEKIPPKEPPTAPAPNDLLTALTLNSFFLQKRLPQEKPYANHAQYDNKLPISRQTLITIIKQRAQQPNPP